MTDLIQTNNSQNNKDSIKKFPVWGIVIIFLAVLAVIISGIIGLSKLQGNSFSAAQTGFGNSDALKNIKVDVDSEGGFKVDVDSFKALDSVKELSGAVVKKGNGEIVKENDKVTISYTEYFKTDYDLSSTPTSQEEAEANKLSELTWQLMPNAAQTQPMTLDAKKATETNVIKSDATKQANQTNPVIEKVQSLLIGQKVGSILAVLLVSDSGESEPPAVLLLNIKQTSSAENYESQKAADEQDKLKEVVSKDVPDNFPKVTEKSGSVPEVSIPKDFEVGDKITVQVLNEGDGEQVKSTDDITIQYAGWLLDGTAFDSSYVSNQGQPTTFSLSRLIEGWKFGLLGQKVGSKLVLTIPWKYAYGEAGSGEKIPPKSDLVFFVEIVDSGVAPQTQQQMQESE